MGTGPFLGARKGCDGQGGQPPAPWLPEHSRLTGFSLSLQLADEQGLILMTTVAMPVFSKQNETVSTEASRPMLGGLSSQTPSDAHSSDLCLFILMMEDI